MPSIMYVPAMPCTQHWSVAYLPPRTILFPPDDRFESMKGIKKADINDNTEEVYEQDVTVREVNGETIYLLREDKTPLSQRYQETVSISTSPAYERYFEGTNVEYHNDRRYETGIRFQPGLPPRKKYSSAICYVRIAGKEHRWYSESVFVRFDLPPQKMFSTKVMIFPKRKVESHVSGVERSDEKVIKYYRVAMELQLRDYVSLELVPIDDQ